MKVYLKNRTGGVSYKGKNRFFYSIVSLMVLVMIFLGGCKKEEPEPSLSLSTNSLEFEFSGGQKTVEITSNTEWTISGDASSWLTFTPTSGSNNGNFMVTVIANETVSKRTATITARGGGLTQSVEVSQEGGPPVLRVSEKSLTLSSGGETKSFTVESNIKWTVSKSVSDWLTISPTAGQNNGTVTVKAVANPFYYERMATVGVTGENNKIERIEVKQLREELDLDISEGTGSNNHFYFEYQGGQHTFHIKVPKPPINWTIEKNSSAASWITISPTSGTNDAIITVVASRNTSSSREGSFTVKGGNILQKMTVEQEDGRGSVAFWTSVDFRCGSITVTLSGQGSRTIDGFYYSGSPSCGDQYTATFNNILRGTYTYTATCSGGRSWSGTVIVNNNCVRVRLS